MRREKLTCRIKVNLTFGQKQVLESLAARDGLSSSEFLRRLLVHAIDVRGGISGDFSRVRTRTRVHVRFPVDVAKSLARLAAAEGRTVACLLRAFGIHAARQTVPFNEHEVDGLREVARAIGPIGRNVNTLVHQIRVSGRGEPTQMMLSDLTRTLTDMRREVNALIDRASVRYDVDCG